MKNQQEKKALEQPNYCKEIYQTIDLLEKKVKIYRQLEIAKNNSYQIHQEFDAINRELSALRLRIEEMTST